MLHLSSGKVYEFPRATVPGVLRQKPHEGDDGHAYRA